MEEDEALDARLNSQVRCIAEGGVTPATSEFIFLVCVLGVMEQQVHTMQNSAYCDRLSPPSC